MSMLEKMPTKKLAVYIFIIVLILAAGFIIYANRASSPAAGLALDDKSAPAEASVSGDELTPNQLSADQLKAVKNSNNFDLTIFSSKKFAELKDKVFISQGNLILGKRDLFKPN